MATTNYNIRIEQDLRDKAFSVLENYGLAPAQQLSYFWNKWQILKPYHCRLVIIKTAAFQI